jgi:hypothetical protein
MTFVCTLLLLVAHAHQPSPSGATLKSPVR